MTDPSLLEGLRSRDPGVIRRLVDAEQRKLLNVILSIVQNREEAEEICQDVFVEAIESVEKFRAEASLSTWLYRIAVNRSLDLVRARSRRKRLAFFFSISPDMHSQNLQDFDHPGVMLERKEQSRYFFRALNELPEKQKVAVVLKELELLSYREIAGVLNVTEGAVESLLVRARQNLRKTLSKYFDEQAK